MKHRCWVVGTAILVLAGLSKAAEAASWIGSSLELTLSDSEMVVRATIDASEPVSGGQILFAGQANNKASLKIKEVLKSPGELSKATTLTALLADLDERKLQDWQNDQTELLVCLVPAERYRAKNDRRPLNAEWAVRTGITFQTGVIPLEGDPGRRAPTLDFVFLKKGEDIRKLAEAVIKEDALHPTARDANGSIPTIEIEVPFGSPMDHELHTRSGNALIVPLTPRTEAAARRWVKSPDSWVRMNAAHVLGHFKSEENIALLKSLLHDPEAQRRISDKEAIVTYPIRAAAKASLKACGVEADAVIEEIRPSAR